jgi:hypothetical protein
MGKYLNPTASKWDKDLPIAHPLTVQSVYLKEIDPPALSRLNDFKVGSGIFPLFSSADLPHNTEDLLQIGQEGNESDHPNIRAKMFFEIVAPEATILWTNTYMGFDSKFVAWTCGYNSVNKQFYPLCERHWSLVAYSDTPNSKPDITLPQTNPTFVPVRKECANTIYADLIKNSELSPDVESGTTILTKP